MSEEAQRSTWSSSPPPPPPRRNDPVDLDWSPTSAIQYGWRVMWARPQIMLVLLVAGLLGFGLSFAGNVVEMFKGPAVVQWTLAVAGMLVQMYFSMTALRYCIKVARGEPADINELFAGGPYLRVLGCAVITFFVVAVWFVPLIVAVLVAPMSSMLMWLVAAGIVLLMVPAYILALGFGQAIALVVDRGLGPVAAMKESWRITSGKKWPLFALGLLGMLVVLAGLLACGIGVFFSVVILQMANVFTYLRLSGQHCAHLDRA